MQICKNAQFYFCNPLNTCKRPFAMFCICSVIFRKNISPFEKCGQKTERRMRESILRPGTIKTAKSITRQRYFGIKLQKQGSRSQENIPPNWFKEFNGCRERTCGQMDGRAALLMHIHLHVRKYPKNQKKKKNHYGVSSMRPHVYFLQLFSTEKPI